MRLADEQYEFIKGEVVAVFERYKIRCIPISGFELAYKMNIKLIPYSSLSVNQRIMLWKCSKDGLYIEDCNGNDLIYFNDIGVSYERMNMTILHEIGHCVLDHKGDSDEEEAEAGFFAKYAAAPPPLVHRIKPTTPDDIADTFDISYEAAINAFEYYQKWLQYGEKEYKGYEIRLLHLFDVG